MNILTTEKCIGDCGECITHSTFNFFSMDFQFHELSYMKASLDLVQIKEDIEILLKERHMIDKKIETKTREQNELTEKCVCHIRVLSKKGMTGDYYCPKKRGITSTPHKSASVGSGPGDGATPSKMICGSYVPNYLPPTCNVMWSPQQSAHIQNTNATSVMPAYTQTSLMPNYTQSSIMAGYAVSPSIVNRPTGGILQNQPSVEFNPNTFLHLALSQPASGYTLPQNVVAAPTGALLQNYPSGDISSHTSAHLTVPQHASSLFSNWMNSVPTFPNTQPCNISTSMYGASDVFYASTNVVTSCGSQSPPVPSSSGPIPMYTSANTASIIPSSSAQSLPIPSSHAMSNPIPKNTSANAANIIPGSSALLPPVPSSQTITNSVPITSGLVDNNNSKNIVPISGALPVISNRISNFKTNQNYASPLEENDEATDSEILKMLEDSNKDGSMSVPKNNLADSVESECGSKDQNVPIVTDTQSKNEIVDYKPQKNVSPKTEVTITTVTSKGEATDSKQNKSVDTVRRNIFPKE